MAELPVVLGPDGEARISLVAGPEPEVRDVIELAELEAAGAVPALESLVLDFDHYGRLVAIRVLAAADSVLAPSLIEAAHTTAAR